MHILKAPTNWITATAVTDAQNAVNAYGSQLKGIYSQWSSPDTGIIPLLKSKGLTGKVLLVSDDGVPFEMCDVSQGTLTASQSQPANLYAYWALKYAQDAAKGVKLTAGEPGGGAPTLAMVSFGGDQQPRRPDRAAVRDQVRADAPGHAGRWPVRRGGHHAGHQRVAVGQRVRQRPRRRLQLVVGMAI